MFILCMCVFQNCDIVMNKAEAKNNEVSVETHLQEKNGELKNEDEQV